MSAKEYQAIKDQFIRGRSIAPLLNQKSRETETMKRANFCRCGEPILWNYDGGNLTAYDIEGNIHWETCREAKELKPKTLKFADGFTPYPYPSSEQELTGADRSPQILNQSN